MLQMRTPYATAGCWSSMAHTGPRRAPHLPAPEVPVGAKTAASNGALSDSGLGQYTVVPHPLEVLMSQQLFSRYPADVVEHGKFWAHLALLMPPLAALLYPFLLAAFHANIAPVISGQSAEPALQSAAATLFLLLAFAAP